MVGNAKQDNEKCKEKQNKTNDKKDSLRHEKWNYIWGSFLRLAIECTGFKVFNLFCSLFKSPTV